MTFNPLLLNLGKRLESLRIQRNLSQVEIAKSADLELQVIKNLEVGHQDTNILELARVAKVLGTSTDALLADL